MAREIIDIGVEGNDGTGDSLRESFRKANENFQELYAVFGIGGQINFRGLSDTPDDYTGLASRILAVNTTEDGVEALELVSNGAITGDPADDTIVFNVTQAGKLLIQAGRTNVSGDTSPQLGGHLNGSNYAIGNVAISTADAAAFTSKYGGNYTIHDLVPDKEYNDQRYAKAMNPGKMGGLRDEPADASEYTLDITGIVSTQDLQVQNHGLDRASNGASYKYTSSQAALTGLTKDQIYYVGITDDNTIRLHNTSADAIANTNSVAITGTVDAGVHKLVDQGLDTQLSGFYLANEALPRKSVVRRAGDKMTGALFAHDHPGALAGTVSPDQEALQVATKLYVDRQEGVSTSNLYVSNSGDDRFAKTNPGKAGRSPSFAFATIGAAARKAEELQIASKFELGNYAQTITHTNFATATTVGTADVKTIPSGRNNVRVLLNENKEFIQNETVAFINATYPDFIYDEALCKRDVGLMIDAVKLDTLTGNNANFLSRRAGIRYYANASATASISTQRTQTIAGIQFVKALVDVVLQNLSPSTTYQSLYTQYINSANQTDATARNSVGAKFDIILGIINDGNVFDAPAIVDGSTYKLTIGNGTTNDFVDQGDPDNTDILPGKVVRGKESGAIGRVVEYLSENLNPSNPANTDILELQLLEPKEFTVGEELEYANTIKFSQISIRIESGTYEEHFPIRLPANVSIKGDEFRRVIIKPKKGASQSPWANVYFYRDEEFDNLRGDSQSITGVPDTNLPTNGSRYVDPLTGNPIGWFGKHYLQDPTKDVNVSNFGINNPGKFAQASQILANNKKFIIEEVISYVDTNYPSHQGNTNYTTKCKRDTGYIVDGLVHDLVYGGREDSLTNQGKFGDKYIPPGQTTETVAAIQYISTLANTILQNQTVTPTQSNEPQIIDTTLTAEANAYTNLDALVDCVLFAFNAQFNPPKDNDKIDVFMCNDGTIVRNCSVTGHGGFMMVLDPDGQVLTKSPYCQTGSSFSRSLNRQAFRGGMLVDAFVGNVPMEVINKQTAFKIDVRSQTGQGLFIKKPQVPSPFYMEGRRFQVNAVRDWDPTLGTATLILDPSSNAKAGWTGTVYGSQVLDNASTINPIEITVQTAGNRSMLGNDFTQVNDLGYGLVVTNGGLSEMVSQFTYYCWTAYYANNGGEIRSLNGSNAYGEYGLVSNGSDPNEVPDAVTLRDNMNKVAKTAEAAVILTFSDAIGIAKLQEGSSGPSGVGHRVTQAGSGASGEVVFETAGKVLYLKTVSGTFDTSGVVTSNDSVTLGVPTDVSAAGLILSQGQLSVYAYDFESFPQNRAEINVLHENGNYGRYEVSSVAKVLDFRVDGHNDVPYTATATGTGAKFDIQKLRKSSGSYVGYIRSPGLNYTVGDTFVVDGTKLDGATTTNDATISVASVDGDGKIQSVTVTGTVNILLDTPIYDGQVYKLNFSTATAGFSNDGLLQGLNQNHFISYRHNQVFIMENVLDTQRLTIRPSTAFEFDERPGYTYRTTEFTTTETTGENLPSDTILMGIDSTYDYVRCIVDPNHTSDTPTAGFGGTTLGATKGDVGIAIQELTEVSDIARLRQGNMIFSWSGKVHRVIDYLDFVGYAVIKIEDITDATNPSGKLDHNLTNNATGIHAPVVLQGGQENTFRIGLPANAPGDITIQISLCRATGHDFLDIGTGSYNTSNYPNVLLGAPRAPNQSYEVQERSKGRVFYVSTDQDGFFRVGRFFTVDQGTGTVTFAGSIALSNLDGIGFKRGVVVSEFSTDDGMTQNGSDIVPTQNAIRGYVNRRLGWDHNGLPVNNVIGGGTLPRDGHAAMTGNLNLGSKRIINVQAPTQDSDAVNKAYVDNVVEQYNTIDGMRDVSLEKPASASALTDANFFKDQLMHRTGKRIIMIDSANIADGPLTANGKLVQGSAIGEIEDITAETDGVLGAVQRVVYREIAGTFTKASAHTEESYKDIATNTTQFTVTHQSVNGGNRYFIDGVQQPTLELEEGNTYIFDWSASSTHPLRFSTTSDGTHGGGTEYTSGVIVDAANKKTSFSVPVGAPTLYYYCEYHPGMGGQANTPAGVQEVTYLGAGINGKINVGRGVDYSAYVTNAGSGYVQNETWTIVGTSLGGATPANDATFTVTSVDGSGAITGFTITGTTGLTTQPTGDIVSGPHHETANATPDPASQIEFTGTRLADEYRVAYNIKDGTILNADVNASAGIAQSKLAMQAAVTKAENTGSYGVTFGGTGIYTFTGDATGNNPNIGPLIRGGTYTFNVQAGPGHPFYITTDDGTNFSAGAYVGEYTSGVTNSRAVDQTLTFVVPQDAPDTLYYQCAFHAPMLGSITIQSGYTQSDLGLAAFDSGDFRVTDGWVTLKGGSVDLADIEEISSLTALGNISNASAVPTEVPITSVGGNDSLVLTKDDGKIRTTGLIVGTDDSYTILQPKSGAATTIQMLTPGGATIFESTGTSAISADFSASINIDNSGADSQSTLQSNSTFANKSRLSSHWIKSNFIEAGNDAGTGIAIGTGTGKTSSGEVGIVTGSSVPFKFSSTGVIPDVTNTINIGSSTAKYNTMYATVFDGTATKARYADLAENYSADTEYEPGTVMVLGGAKEITTTTTKGDSKVIGVVSNKPAYLMNSELQGEFITPVALTGRVPCKVIGKVEPGDILVSSAIAGYAIVNNNPEVGTVIGKAMETKDSVDKGTIEIVVGKV